MIRSFNLVNTYQTLVNNGFTKNIVYFDVRYFYISKIYVYYHMIQKI